MCVTFNYNFLKFFNFTILLFNFLVVKLFISDLLFSSYFSVSQNLNENLNYLKNCRKDKLFSRNFCRDHFLKFTRTLTLHINLELWFMSARSLQQSLIYFCLISNSAYLFNLMKFRYKVLNFEIILFHQSSVTFLNFRQKFFQNFPPTSICKLKQIYILPAISELLHIHYRGEGKRM